jgi:hypothetical protein
MQLRERGGGVARNLILKKNNFSACSFKELNGGENVEN